MQRIGKKQIILYVVIFFATIAADQLFKKWIVANIPLNSTQGSGNIPLIPGIVHLTYIRNAGAAFGMMQGGRWLFLLLLAVFAVLVIFAMKKDWLPDVFSRSLAVLALGGAVANGIDRALYGYVVDMFEVEFMHFAVFNVADAALCVAGFLFVIVALLHKEPEEVKKDESLS